MTDNRTQVFDVAMKNGRTIEACVDRLSMMGAISQAKFGKGGRGTKARRETKEVLPRPRPLGIPGGFSF